MSTEEDSDNKDASAKKLKVVTFRMPMELFVQLKALKETRANPLIADTAFFVEAMKLYIALGMEYGLTSSLEVEGIDALLGKGKKPLGRVHSAHPR